MPNLRFSAVKEASNRKPVEAVSQGMPPPDYYGSNVFDRKAMKKYLSKETYQSVTEAIDKGVAISRETANLVAADMRTWAMERGVTHYTHWFHPLTDGTAEKHDTFIEPDGMGGVIETFSGKILAQQEPDASSFPSGGLRNTFEARGYSAWDPSSPAFIIDDTLCIPTVFISYTGEALDYKTPLLKSLEALNQAVLDVCRYFDPEVKKTTTYLGWEQEYFLVDKALYAARPDLALTGRTLMGHESAKNQQLEDHYFGAIPQRVREFMKEVEFESYKLGIPLKTRHNETAPNQFEFAPVYEEANLSVDHNLLLMALMKRIARRHNFRVLLHEKPFKGVNGSGKHCNWSFGTDTGIALLSPGKDTRENIRFIAFITNVLLAVYKHNSLLKASISSATNMYRLGANEAPPAIISVFLGSQINEILDKFENSTPKDAIVVNDKKEMKLGVGQIPELLLDNTDRNRTSPFAFTGNRFEFRAVGSSANSACALIALNSAVATQLKAFKNDVDTLIEKGKSKKEAIFEILKHYLALSKPIRFDGNGYSNEWRKEAEKRGLDCETGVPLIYDAYTRPETVKMFADTQVLSAVELHARNEVKWEMFTKKIQIEARVLGDLSLNHIIPVCMRYQTLLLENVAKMKDVFSKALYKTLAAEPLSIIESIALHVNEINSQVYKMIDARKNANSIDDARERAVAYHNNVVPFLDSIRHHIDSLELTVDNEMWPLPKYRELLFMR